MSIRSVLMATVLSLISIGFVACGGSQVSEDSQGAETLNNSYNSTRTIWQTRSFGAKNYLPTTNRYEAYPHYTSYGGPLLSFKVYKNPGYSRIGLYRCKINGKHFLSIHSNCEGFQSEGQLGYVTDPRLKPSNISAHQILYRCKDPAFDNAHYVARACYSNPSDGVLAYSAP